MEATEDNSVAVTRTTITLVESRQPKDAQRLVNCCGDDDGTGGKVLALMWRHHPPGWAMGHVEIASSFLCGDSIHLATWL